MDQFAEIEIGFEKLVEIIKNYLVQEESLVSTDYTIEYEITGSGVVYLYVVKPVMIGKLKGVIKEELDDDTLADILDDYIDTQDYTYNDINYNIETDQKDSTKKILKGVRLDYEPVYEESFIKEL